MVGANEKIIKSQIKDPELIREKHLQIAIRASKLFTKKGYADTGMREISKATGITIGNLYDYITKKEDILCLVFDAFYSTWTENLNKHGVFAIEDPAKQLRTALRMMLELVHNYRDIDLLMYRESMHLPKKYLKIILEKELEFIGYFEMILKRGVEKKVFNIKDPFFTAGMIVYQISFEALRGWSLKGRYTDEEIINFIEEIILKSVQS
jgi:AcrR family transcriptional regulator